MAKPSKLQVYSLGVSGVILDLNPLDPSLPLDALVIAQNVIHDPKSLHGGGLRNRDGLMYFNAAYMGGSILGGAPMVVPGTGGAPTPTGPTIPGGTPGTPVEPSTGDPADPGGPGIPTSPGVRTIVVGRIDSSTTLPADSGWFLTTPLVATPPTIDSTFGPPGIATRSIPFYPNWATQSGFATAAGFLYYPGWTTPDFGPFEDRTQDIRALGNAVTPTLRRVDGTVDQEVCSIPIHTALEDDHTLGTYSYGPHPAPIPPGGGVVQQRGDDAQPAIVSIIAATTDVLYLGIADVGASYNQEIDPLFLTYVGTDIGRIFRYTISTNLLVEIPLVTPGDTWEQIPYCMAWFGDQLWFGGYSAATASAEVWRVDPLASLPEIRIADASPVLRPTVMIVFDGNLFIGYQNRDPTGIGGSTFHANIEQIDVDSTAVTMAQPYVGPDGIAGSSNGYVTAVEFLGSLYFSWVDPGVKCRVYRYNPSTLDWTVVLELTGAASAFALHMVVDQSTLYLFGGIASSGTGGTRYMATTPDGVTFTDRTTAFYVNANAGDRATGILYGVDG